MQNGSLLRILLVWGASFFLTAGTSCSSAGETNNPPARASGLKAIFQPGKLAPTNQICAGVNIHFTKGHIKDLDMIAAAGIRFIRMDFLWQNIEQSKGVYNWSAYDELTENLRKRGIDAIYILDYSNSLYEELVESKDPLTGADQKDIASPGHPESVAAFAKWAAAAAEHFKGNNIVWEIWNEPNVSFWRPQPDIDQYIRLAFATCKAVKDADPNAVIIGPATSQIPFPFLETFLASGILEYLDGVSIHPYRDYSMPPETAGTDYEKLRSLIEKYAPARNKNIPVISSEWGYASATKGISTGMQAEYIVRMQLFNLFSGVPVSIWYDWKNDGENPSDFEHNCGTVSYNLKPKPSYISMQTMNNQLKGYTLISRITTTNDKDFLLLFKNDKGRYKISAWTLDPEHSVVLEKKYQGTGM